MLNTLKHWWQQRRRTQQQHTELAGMTERDWSDLGAGRSEMDYWLAQQARADLAGLTDHKASLASRSVGVAEISIR